MNTALEHWAEIEPLLDQALGLAPEERAAFLDRLPEDRQHWRATLAELLKAGEHAAAAGFLERPASLAGAAMEGEAWQNPLHEGLQIGPWVLQRELGQGGMASVWLARPAQGDFKREVALKLPHGASPLLAERFRRERDVLARLTHPGIARLYDAGVTESGLPWLAMERVEGMELLGWCDAHKASVSLKLDLLLQVCDALQYAHGQLVIHRDIKPANVLVQEDGQVRVLDFGIAHLLEPGELDMQLTRFGSGPMTPEYASPEQVRGGHPGVASDVYALGVLAYRLLAGVSPYAGAAADNRHALERAILEYQPQAPSVCCGDRAGARVLRGDLDTIVLKALAKDVRDRYQSIDAFATDLRRYRAGLPVSARPQVWPYLAWRFVLRHKLACAASAIAVAVLMTTTVWALHSASEARQQARRSEAMYSFLVSLFNPRNSPIPDTRDRDLPVRELIERGSGRILDSLQDEPQVRDRLLTDLGALTQQLGLNPLSQKLRSERVAMAGRLYGEQSVAYADALMGMRESWEVAGQFKEGIAAAGKALEIYAHHRERNPLKLALAHMVRGGFAARVHRPSDEDVADLKLAAQLLEPLSGPSLLGTVYEQLAVAYSNRGQMEQAYRATKAGLAANRRLWGEEDWKSAASEEQAGLLASLTMRPAEAERLLSEGLQRERRVIGPDVVILARGEASLAQLLYAAGRRVEALAHLHEAQRVVDLPANKTALPFRLTVEAAALGIALQEGDWSRLSEACAPRGSHVEAPIPALRINIGQACAASAIHDGDLARAQALLIEARGVANKAFAHAPARSAVLALREGELAQARGEREAAVEKWRESVKLADDTGLAVQVQAWKRLRSTGLSASEQIQFRAFMNKLSAAGGERYYGGYFAQLR